MTIFRRLMRRSDRKSSRDSLRKRNLKSAEDFMCLKMLFERGSLRRRKEDLIID